MEVLVSLGVIAVGLMSVASLMPAAHYQAERGARNDRKASVGRRAFREFHVRELARPGKLLSYDPVDDAWKPWLPVSPQPFCIDPRLLASVNEYNPAALVQPIEIPLALQGRTRQEIMEAISWFPIDTRTAPPQPIPQMRRVTLRSELIPMEFDPTALDPTAPQSPMGLAQADAVFVMRDDLDFDIPSPSDQPSRQLVLRDPNRVAIERTAREAFSWFATMVPELGGESDLYRLSIAVVYQRAPIRLSTWNVTNSPPISFPGGVRLSFADRPTYLQLKRLDWVLLGGGQTFRWYRVQRIDYDSNNPPREIGVTLNGPEWPATGGPTLFVVPQDEIVNVYEKTIRIESSSMWTQ